jgi:uncharacterized damage-inducible protein DinB
MKRNHAAVCAALVALAAAPLLAQDANPLTSALKGNLDMVKGNLIKSAEQVPETDYGFKPTPEVRSLGQILAHVADANYMICGAASGEKGPAESVEKTKTSKADIAKALGDSFEFCDKAFEGMTDASGAAMVSFFGRQSPKLGVLAFATGHDWEHYGNIVTYMRLKGMVPPSSQRKAPPSSEKKAE